MERVTQQLSTLVSRGQDLAAEQPGVAAVAGVAALGLGAMVCVRIVTGGGSMARDGQDFTSVTAGAKMLNNADSVLDTKEVKKSIDEYEGLFKGARQETGAITSEESVEVRRKEYGTMINHFYNLVTDFYEWGWGPCFHFAPRHMNETFMESIKRAEHHLVARLGLRPGMKALDVGCGVGGPMRNIAIHSGASIEGITINEYQVRIGNRYNEQYGLAHIAHSTQGDFQHLPFNDGSFDAAYAIEATCHSPDKVGVFSEVYRILRPGGAFACYEWVVQNDYDENNPEHVRIKEGIEVGNGLPTLATPEQVVEALEKAGFEVEEHYDANRDSQSKYCIPWYETLKGQWSLSGFRMTHLGRICTHAMVWTMELLRIAPRGSTQVSTLLNKTALDLVAGGEKRIFTPSYYVLARKRA